LPFPSEDIVRSTSRLIWALRVLVVVLAFMTVLRWVYLFRRVHSSLTPLPARAGANRGQTFPKSEKDGRWNAVKNRIPRTAAEFAVPAARSGHYIVRSQVIKSQVVKSKVVRSKTVGC
jgi:hypothetical protein